MLKHLVMNKEELKLRTKEFAHKCVKLAMLLPDNNLGRVIQYQLIKCSTSTAANYRATCIAQSKKSFIAKLSIVIEEVDESNFWIEFIIDEKLIVNNETTQLLNESSELTAIFMASRKTAENN